MDMSGGVKVLVVDDSEDQRLLLRTYLERAGCTVQVAATAEEAIASYRDVVPDLAIIDLVLPGMDGWELADRMRKCLPQCPQAITSVLNVEDFPPSEAFLPKPVTGAAIRQVLHDLVPKWSAA
jgi:CheY-like chemotaxis protein